MNIFVRARPSIAWASARVGPGLATPLLPDEGPTLETLDFAFFSVFGIKLEYSKQITIAFLVS